MLRRTGLGYQVSAILIGKRWALEFDPLDVRIAEVAVAAIVRWEQ